MFALTDHGPEMPGAPHRWHFANSYVIPRFLHGVAFLRGVEANILNDDGDIDLEPMILDRLDWVIGSLGNWKFA
ncbi:hypothetical protein [Parendozoicomonas sp. Alg238-R29]|uniref:hypothetical protein n=1 Tax=Parendozoicomonas sp. Alg238-R29 TaxID=2993446 RepID=UPI00248E7DBE|nr:hypothetical protein [Parendozoicomonas sp. Alg238-R29]